MTKAFAAILVLSSGLAIAEPTFTCVETAQVAYDSRLSLALFERDMNDPIQKKRVEESISPKSIEILKKSWKRAEDRALTAVESNQCSIAEVSDAIWSARNDYLSDRAAIFIHELTYPVAAKLIKDLSKVR